MARRLEPALRIHLDGSTDAVLARSGVHLTRGREVFFLSDRAMNALAEEWVGRRDTLEALGAALRAHEGETAPSQPGAPEPPQPV